MQVIEDASTASLRPFLLDHVQPGTIVVTDGRPSYPSACGDEYTHQPEPIAPSGLAHELLPGVHRVASLVQRWLLGTHQGAVKPGHLQAYLDEFAFRFNRRRSRARGMLSYRLLEHSVQAPPRTLSLAHHRSRLRPRRPAATTAPQARPTCQPRRRAPRAPVAPPVKPAKPINPHRLH